MSVKRKKDGSISIQSSNGATVIGKIFVNSDDKREEKFGKWVEECAKLVTPCEHTFKETEEYFLQSCDALPISPDDMRIKNFKQSIIMNYFRDKLKNQASEFSFDMTDEEIEVWDKEQTLMHQEAMNSSPEDFGLNMRGYYLPYTKRNEPIYEEACLEAQRDIRDKEFDFSQIQKQDICFFFEETTCDLECRGGGRSLMEQLIVFRGVSREDIEARSPRFMGYITALREMGKLTNF